MTSFVGVAAVTLLLGYPVASIDQLDTRHYPVRVRGLACEKLEDLKPTIELMATLPPDTTLGTVEDKARSKGFKCGHYDALMYDVGIVSEAGGQFEINGKRYYVRRLLFGTTSHHVEIYIALSVTSP